MSRLNYHHLYYFWQVAKQGNLTQAAQNLHISQSALSSQIKQLEQSLNVQLFERKGRRLLLTEEGYHALNYADDIFHNGEELEKLLTSGKGLAGSTIRIGMLSTISRNFIEQFIQPLIKQSDCRYVLQSMSQTGLLEALNELQIDVALTNTPLHDNSKPYWQSRVLARQAVAIIGPPGLDLNEVFDERYRGQRWVLPYGENPLRAAFNSFSAQYHLQPEIVAESDDMAMLRLLTRDTGALAVMPEVVVKDELDNGTLKRYMLLPDVYESFYSVTVKRKVVHPKLDSLLRPLL
ncbi:LysR family transcriptional regulator [Vibrio palustris]|uniref:Transcriptional activator protein NhaR n=1 Tax=Vibrio palustris TaxID=1918946 RepID=A0A1R4B6A6_9VIBR|nr:LysR family transcriptional regulator [Vibrio palustris]SJL84455.1 Transcriptional activator protein NhaR [Vibrio palustris]